MKRNLGRFHRSKSITLLKRRSIVCRANDGAVAASAGLSSTASGGTEQMIALLAICRKVIILDLKQTDASQTFALAAAILALTG